MRVCRTRTNWATPRPPRSPIATAAGGCRPAGLSENTSGERMKNNFPHRRLLLATALASAFPAWAGPQGEQLTAGQGTVTRDGAVTTIQQGSSRLAINWQAFGIAAG